MLKRNCMHFKGKSYFCLPFTKNVKGKIFHQCYSDIKILKIVCQQVRHLFSENCDVGARFTVFSALKFKSTSKMARFTFILLKKFLNCSLMFGSTAP